MKRHTHSEPGGKVVNEDFLLVRPHPSASEIYVGALADGQGGRSNAAPASKAACEAVWSLASALSHGNLLQAGTWPRILQQADAAVGFTGGFTTLVAFAISREAAAGASVGDSKAYFMRPSDKEMAEWTAGQRKNPPVGSGSVDAGPWMRCPSCVMRLAAVACSWSRMASGNTPAMKLCAAHSPSRGRRLQAISAPRSYNGPDHRCQMISV